MTEKTQPTDAEIIALADETRTREPGREGYSLPISFTRADLAKRGTPDGEHTNAELQQMLDECYEVMEKCYFALGQHQKAIDNLIAERDALKAAHSGRPVAQEPFGYANTSTGQFFTDVELCRKNNEGHWRTVYIAPQPSPAAQGDALDAARWRMAALVGNEVMVHPDKRNHAAAVAAYMQAVSSGLDLTTAIDAARAAQEGK